MSTSTPLMMEPCSECGSDVEVFRQPFFTKRGMEYRYYCRRCGVCGPRRMLPGMAMSDWNSQQIEARRQEGGGDE